MMAARNPKSITGGTHHEEAKRRVTFIEWHDEAGDYQKDVGPAVTERFATLAAGVTQANAAARLADVAKWEAEYLRMLNAESHNWLASHHKHAIKNKILELAESARQTIQQASQ